MLKIEKEWIKCHFPTLCEPRMINSHKGTYGTVGIIGGANGMVGAPILAARAALKLGAGKVFIGFVERELPLNVIFNAPEIMIRKADDLLLMPHLITTWVVGCGFGLNEYSKGRLEQLLKIKETPIIFDADALTLLAEKRWQAERDQVVIMTPHPQEAARLLGTTTEEIQKNRAKMALEIAEKYQVIAILKGHRTVIAKPKEIIWENSSGNPGLATAGTGDVLAGMIGSLIAQNIPFFEAVTAAVWLHGAAADSLVLRGVGPIGLTASELCDEARKIRNQLTI